MIFYNNVLDCIFYFIENPNLLKNKEHIKAYLAWVTICLVWGTTYLAIRVGVSEFPPFFFAGFRWIIAGSILLTIMKLRGYKLPSKKDLPHIAVVGITLLGIANGFVVLAEQWLPSGLTALFITTIPILVALFELFTTEKKTFNIYLITGLVFGFLGVVLMLSNNLNDIFSRSYLLGFLFLFIAVTSWAGGSVYSKHNKLKAHPLMGASIQMLLSGTLQIIVGIILGEHTHINDITPTGIYSLLYLIVFGSIFGYGSYMYAISHLPVSFVSTYAYINPVIALFVGWIFLNEKINLQIIAAALIILFAVWLVKKGSILRNVKI